MDRSSLDDEPDAKRHKLAVDDVEKVEGKKLPVPATVLSMFEEEDGK